MFTSAALGILVEADQLSWKDTIKSHITEFDPINDPNIGAKATIVDACRHSTGLANPNCVMLGPEGTYANKPEDHIAMVNALPTSNKSGQRFGSWWYYSNATFGLMGYLVEVVSKMKYSDFLKTRVLDVLGLKQTMVTEADVEINRNIAHPYVQMSDGEWSRIRNPCTSETNVPILSSMGIRSSVNDMLAFVAAVLNRYDWERDVELSETNIELGTGNPLRQITALWNHWWTRPVDHVENETAYLLGWYKTIMPTASLGFISYNPYGYGRKKENAGKYIIGKDSPAWAVYGHHGITNGSVATVYVVPDTRSAVVVFANAADAGDAAETTAQILIQALFDLKPHVNLLPAVQESRDSRLKMHEDMISSWEQQRDVSKYTGQKHDFLGTYIGLATSRIDIVSSDNSSSGLAVVFGEQMASRCELSPYNADALSFLPMKHDELLARGMIDWDYHRVGIFEFLREDQTTRTGAIVGLRWQWDEYDFPGLWVRERSGMGRRDIADIQRRYGMFQENERADENAESSKVGL